MYQTLFLMIFFIFTSLAVWAHLNPRAEDRVKELILSELTLSSFLEEEVSRLAA